MTETAETLKPLVVRRGAEYVVLNVPDLESYTSAQRVGVAMLAWDQMEKLMQANGESTQNRRATSAHLGRALGCPATSVYQAHYAMRRDGAEHLSDLIEGKVDFTNFCRRSGLKIKYYAKDDVTRASNGITYYGKGDPFVHVTEPLRRYLRSWRKRNFEYRHVAPREAKKRLTVVKSLIADLQEVERDLTGRSHLATLAAPPEGRKEKNKT